MAGPKDIAKHRLFNRMFICMDCNSRIRANPAKVRERKIKCRRCGSKALRAKSKESRG